MLFPGEEMRSIVELIAVLGLGVFPFLVSSILTSRDGRKNAMDPFWGLAYRLVDNLCIIALVVFVALSSSGGLAAVGLRIGKGAENWNGVIWALFGMELPLGVWALILRMVRGRKGYNQESADPSNMAADDYRTPLERVSYLLVLVWTVAAEDLVFRGYLVLFWGARIGSYWPVVIVSVLLSVIAHLYQGRSPRLIFGHLIVAATMNGLLIWSGNIIPIILAHFVLDGILIFRRWHQIRPDTNTQSVPERLDKPQHRYALLGSICLVLAAAGAYIV